MRQNRSNPAIRWLAGAALLLASGAAMALGLGDIRVKSRPGQPLVAEIPIVSSDPAEMEQLRAKLASPETFERVGLERPHGLVSGLSFMVAVSDDGKPIIRVTSSEPVTQDVVSFLIEVDWGQGRLVREYAALVAAPGTVAAAAEPGVEAPTPAPSDVIAREPAPPASERSAPAPSAPPAPSVAAAPEPPKPETPAPVEAPPPRRAPAVSPAALLAGNALAPVRRGQTLSGIAGQLGGGQSLNQTMLALLRANPDAFIRGNINLLKQGAVLRVPSSAEFNQLSRAEANALVGQQAAEWRQARRPVPQPVAAAAAARPAAPAAKQAAPVDAAHLEIAPAAADAAKRKGTTSGTQAGGEGDMLANQEVRQAKEDLAASQAEVQELRSRVAELEKIKQDQARLIAMKDSDLAAAQQRLAQAQGGQAGQPLWLWAGLALVVAGLVAWWLFARNRKEKAPRSRFDVSTLAAAVPPAVAADARHPEAGEEADAPAWAERQVAAAPGRPAWHIDDPSLNVAPINAAPAGRDRLELAIAYLDLGDKSTARSLLNEVVAGSDADARAQAARLLQGLD